MKNIIIAILLLFLLQYVTCNDVLLTKFRQNGYKMKNVRIQLMSYDNKTFNFFQIKAFKYNRTTTAHNATINLKVEIENKAEIRVQVYKFLSNEYRHFPIRFQVNLKKAFDANVIGLHNIKNCGNLTSFYFHKDITYYVCNFVIDETRFPPLVPNGVYQVEITILYLNKEIGLVYLFAEIYIPIEYPKTSNLSKS